jgi:pyridoxine kinase
LIACSSHSLIAPIQGYVGNKSAVFPLQLLGFDVDPINSVQFSNHTGKCISWMYTISYNSLGTHKQFQLCVISGYPTFRGQVLNGKQLWDLIEGLEENQLLHYTHLLTGETRRAHPSCPGNKLD